MIERLQRALLHLDELSPEAQQDLAQQIADLIDPHDAVAALQETAPHEPAAADAPLPPSVRAALAFAGAWSDLQGDDEFAALDRMRHERVPTPPMDDRLALLDDQDPSAGRRRVRLMQRMRMGNEPLSPR